MYTQELHDSAQKGDISAQYIIATCFEHGNGITKHEGEAFRYYKMAADNKHPAALNALGRCYELGIGVPNDENEAFSYYGLAATYELIRAFNNLGRCFANGIGTEVNPQLSFLCYFNAVHIATNKSLDKTEEEALPLLNINLHYVTKMG